MNTGDKIARLRKENNYTQEQLAVKAMRQEIPNFYQWIVNLVEKIL